MICVRNLTKKFGEFKAVDNISFDVNTGEIFGFIGPNGAGKTTTIRMLATLLESDAGSAWIDGYSIRTQQKEVRKKIGYMPDYFGVYEGVTVWEYLDFFARAYQISIKNRNQIIEQCLELTDFSKSRNKLVASLSKGMTQRLCLAKTLLHDPKVLILDEPTSGLDPRARIEFRMLIKELSNMNKTIFISSHILTELADFVTHIGIMEKGKIVITGRPEEISKKISEEITFRSLQEENSSVISSKENGQKNLELNAENNKIAAKIIELTISTYQGQKLSEAETILKNDPNIVSISFDASNLEVKYNGLEQNIYQIIKKLVLADIPIVKITPNTKNLEEIFMTLTKGDVE